MPDREDLVFPNLVDAFRVESTGTVYKYFEPLVDTGGPVVPGGFPVGFGMGIHNGTEYIYVATDDGVFRHAPNGPSTFNSVMATVPSLLVSDFLQFEEYEIVTFAATPPVKPHYQAIGTSASMATLGSSTGDAPIAVRVGRINQFVFLGNISQGQNAVQWSGIDQPTSWPTPNTATATAQQSGEQFLDAAFGEVTGFSNGDQFGLIFQTSAITRVTYVGPPVVFQFDKITDQIGCPYPRSIVQVDRFTYFVAADGFYRTDGVSIENIGLNKVNKYFRDRHGSRSKQRVYGAHNRYRNLIYWTLCNTSDPDSTPSDLIIFNHVTGRFTNALQACQGILSTTGFETYFAQNIRGFGASNTLGAFTSGTTAGIASIETGDIEFNPGGFAHLSGAKLLVDATANSVVAYSKIRNELMSNQLTTSAASTTNSATGFADFRREARYHRILFELNSTFEQAQSMEFKAFPSGGR
jgi:hypothetical protein